MSQTGYSYIDLESFKKSTFDDADIQKEIIEVFFEILDEYITALNTELPNKNWNVLFKATHKIKPNIHMFGISKLESTILSLENNFRNEENLDAVKSQVSYCLDILKQVEKELQTELKSMQNV